MLAIRAGLGALPGRDCLTVLGESVCHEPQPLTIQQASDLLSVPAATLRSWERRYGLPTTIRTVGRHRRYDGAAMAELRVMRDEIARGKRAGEAAIVVRGLRTLPEPAARLVSEFLQGAATLDPTAVRATLDRATREMDLAAVIDDVLMPSMRQIGHWWESGRCDVAHEHLATEAARTWLGRVIAFATPPADAPDVLLACGPRDTHTLGLEAFAVLLADGGYRCRLLGARTPVPTLHVAVQASHADAVVLVSHLAIGRRPTSEAIRRTAALGVPVFYAGNAYLGGPSRRGLPGIYLGDNLRRAVTIVEAAVRAAVSAPKPATIRAPSGRR